jgi:site-specific DNA recombinase
MRSDRILLMTGQAQSRTPNGVIYTRVSRDPNGDELAIRRQRRDCEELCERAGIKIVGVFEDDDLSAYSGKPRPGFKQMRERIEAGDVDVVVAWHPDRITRQPRELEDLIDLLEKTQTTVRTVRTGDYDLATPSGRMTARVVGAVARGESEHKSDRIRRKHRELAENGKISGGGSRPFGYREDRVTIDKTEAKVIRELADRILAGETIRGLVADLNARGIATTTGGKWSPHVLRSLMIRPRIAGIREHGDDKLYARTTFPAQWKGIISEAEHRRLRTILTDPSRRKNRGQPPRLLTGIAVCSKCGSPMRSLPRADKTPTYVCSARNLEEGSCKLRILGETVDELVVEAVFCRLDHANLPAARPPRNDLDADRELVEIESRQTELGEMWESGEIDRAGWKAASAKLEQRRRELVETMQTETRSSLVDQYVGAGLLRRSWPNMTNEQRRTVLSAVIDRVVIGPAVRGRNFFDPSRVSVDWKV